MLIDFLFQMCVYISTSRLYTTKLTYRREKLKNKENNILNCQDMLYSGIQGERFIFIFLFDVWRAENLLG